MSYTRLNPAQLSGNGSITGSGFDSSSSVYEYMRYGNVMVVSLWAKLSTEMSAWTSRNTGLSLPPSTMLTRGWTIRQDGPTGSYFQVNGNTISLESRGSSHAANVTLIGTLVYVCA